MSPKQAKAELKQIMSQKTVSVSRLRKILSVLDYEELEKQYIKQGHQNKRMKIKLNRFGKQLQKYKKGE